MNISYVKAIGIHGPLNGGKDTVANYICAKYPAYFNRYAFAKPIKEAAQIIFGFTDEQLEDRALKEAVDPFWGFSPRTVFQRLGTEFGRNLMRDDMWVKRAELEHQSNLSQGKGTIITDIRFENEAEWFRTLPSSVLIYIQAPNLVRDEKYQHASEAGIKLDERDHLIINDKSKGLNNLFKQIDQIFK